MKLEKEVKMAGIWIFSENTAVAKQLITLGSELQRTLHQTLRMFCFTATEGVEFLSCGADESIVISDSKKEDTVNYMGGISKCIRDEKPTVFLIGRTENGRRLAAGLAIDFTVEEATDAFSIMSTSDGLIMEKHKNGKVYKTKQSIPCLITIMPSVYREAKEENTSGHLIHRKMMNDK